MRLYHYTCRDSATLIDRDGHLLPMPQVQLGGPVRLVWLTDLAVPDRDALGLTSHTLSCDRTECQYTVDCPRPIPWSDWADLHGVHWQTRRELEQGRKPQHWYVWPARIAVVAKEMEP